MTARARHHRFTTWRSGALLIVAAVTVANVIHTARKAPPPPLGVSAAAFDPLTFHEERFRVFRARAAAQGVRGPIGYVGDTADADDDYYYAQFALVPLVLDLNPAPHDWAVANLRTTTPADRVPPGWRVAADCGAGVLLLRKGPP